MSLKPLGDRIVITPIEEEEQTQAGIFLPSAARERTNRGTVVATGPGNWHNGKRIPTDVNPGDTVVYSPFAGVELEVHGESVLVITASDVLAVESND